MTKQEQANGVALEQRQAIRGLNAYLGGAREHFALVTPPGVDVDRLIRLALNAAQNQPLLLGCSRESIALSLMEAAHLGLEPNLLGQGWLIPRKSRNSPTGWSASFQPGYQGLIELVLRTGMYEMIEAEVVYADELPQFAYRRGTNPSIEHLPMFEIDRSKEALALAYAIAWPKGSSRPQFVVLGPDEVGRARDKSAAKSNGPWVTDTAEMWKKTAVRNLVKYLRKTPALEDALAHDTAVEIGGDSMMRQDLAVRSNIVEPETIQSEDVEEEESKTKADVLADELEAANGGTQEGLEI